MTINSGGVHIPASLVLVTGPQQEPVTLDEAKVHLGVSGTARDFSIQALIIAAREWAEHETHRRLITQTWDWRLDEFPASPADLPLVPVQSVSSISYIDENGDAQTMPTSDYTVDARSEPGRIVLTADGDGWPTLGDTEVGAVTIRIVAGYGLSAKVPRTLKLAMLLHIEAHFDRDERSMRTILEAASNLMKPHVFYRIAAH